MAAELALSRGALAQASNYYAQAARVSPDPRVSERAVQLALSLDNRPRTTRLLKRWLSLDADQFDARQLLAFNQLRSNQPDQALATLQAGMPRSQEAREAALASISRLFQDPS
jgi:cytochrome c-type biogenesis protein CcmH/NrfG